MNAVRLQDLHRAPPQQPSMSVLKLEGGAAASVTGTEELCDIKWDYHIVTMINHVGVTI
jgi:hypothetical protein